MALGSSQFANKAFRQSTLKTLNNINNPNRVDVETHIETSGSIETINVRGRKEIRLFTFDFDEAKKRAEKLSEGTDPFQVFNGVINQIIMCGYTIEIRKPYVFL